MNFSSSNYCAHPHISFLNCTSRQKSFEKFSFYLYFPSYHQTSIKPKSSLKNKRPSLFQKMSLFELPAPSSLRIGLGVMDKNSISQFTILRFFYSLRYWKCFLTAKRFCGLKGEEVCLLMWPWVIQKYIKNTGSFISFHLKLNEIEKFSWSFVTLSFIRNGG